MRGHGPIVLRPQGCELSRASRELRYSYFSGDSRPESLWYWDLNQVPRSLAHHGLWHCQRQAFPGSVILERFKRRQILNWISDLLLRHVQLGILAHDALPDHAKTLRSAQGEGLGISCRQWGWPICLCSNTGFFAYIAE